MLVMMVRHFWIILLLTVCPLSGGEPRHLEIIDPLSFRAAPIDYFGEETTNAITQLQSRMARGEVTFNPRGRSGYLLDLLEALNIVTDSQTLVFSKTSIHQGLISPKTPRAIYFNDEVSVAWIPEAKVIEIAAQDSAKGAIFYTMSQPDNAAPLKPIAWHREERCVACHVSTSTLNVPGHLLRSFQVNERGEPRSGYTGITQDTPFTKRWGGWYVTGSADRLVHGGNLFGPDDARRHEHDGTFRGTMDELSPLVDLTGYPSAHSDIVAQLVLNHQLHFYNLVTRVQYESRLSVRSDAEKRLARYAMMEDEAPLAGPVKGSTRYSAWYQAITPEDGEENSLRQLNLETRLFEGRPSPLVHSRSFKSLPDDVKERLWQRFGEKRAVQFDPLK
jgi:hypothetical protein